MHGMAAHLRRTNAAFTFQPGKEIRPLLQLDVSCSVPKSLHSLTSAFHSALAFECTLFVFVFFPVAPNPDLPNFNWTTLVFGVTVVWAIGYYHVWGKKNYAGPVEYVKRQDL
jgi:hypothetical protein